MMGQDIEYLASVVGPGISGETWDRASSLPLYLRSGNSFQLVHVDGVEFLLVKPRSEASLPDAKRISRQLGERTGIPIVLSIPDATARQRAALVRQRIPFVAANRQAFLPFIGAASVEWGRGRSERQSIDGKLSPKAQQTAIWGALRGGSYTIAELRFATDMSASQASGAIAELSDHGLAKRSRMGRTVLVDPIDVDELLSAHMGILSSPVVRIAYVELRSLGDDMVRAGESALAARTQINPPRLRQLAISKKALSDLGVVELIEGERPDEEVAQLQVWKYDPVYRGNTDVDDISLALSFAFEDDERIAMEIAGLFGKEYPWEQAR